MTVKKSQSTWLVAVIVGAIVVMTCIVLIVLLREHIINISTRSNTTSNTQLEDSNAQTFAANNAIQAQAIEQKDPALCTQISGPTSVSFSLPTPDNGVQNTTRTFDQAESIARCQTQAKAGTPFVY